MDRPTFGSGDPPDFLWPVLVNGYAWVRAPGGPWLVGRPWDTDEAEVRVLPGLHRDFAALEHSQKSILAFATLHGLLGEPDGRVQDNAAPGRSRVEAESIGLWRAQISLMRRACALWDAVRQEDHRRLQRWIQLEEGRARLAGSVGAGKKEPAGRRTRTSDMTIDEADEPAAMRLIASEPTRREQRLLAARLFIATITNRQMNGRVDYQLMVNKKSRLFSRPAPRNLIGAMWVQLAEVVDTPAEERRCVECGQSMLISASIPGGRRRQSLYCSNACKQRRARRKQRARLLLAEGGSRRSVAEELDIHESELALMGL